MKKTEESLMTMVDVMMMVIDYVMEIKKDMTTQVHNGREQATTV